MLYDVVTFANDANPDNAPPQCISYTRGVPDTLFPLTPGAVRMTESEERDYRGSQQAAFDAWKASLVVAKQAAIDALEPDLADLRDAATAAINNIDSYLAIADTATAAQVRAEVKAIDQRQKRIIKALFRLAQKQLTQ